ncbi:MAG: DUF2779 domain-containing protein [Patescibacteria group bacterium]|nr:DUF2779 domain-containing protein [Patescibacteria group bacterium]
MSNLINKTQYIEFLDCRKNSWLKIHKPELIDLYELSDFELNLLRQGNDVEEWARLLFPNGLFITPTEDNAVELSKKYIAQKTPVIFQPTSVYDVFLARHDILEYDQPSGKWNLYEVKSTSSVKENSKEIDHIEDASFQVVILKETGIELNKIFIICLNKEYIRSGNINSSQLFQIDDVTAEVNAREESTRQKMQEAKAALLQDDETALECLCIYKGRSAQCTTFKHSYPHVPEYSVHDIYMIGKSKKKLAALVDQEVFALENIPEEFELSPHQSIQVKAHKQAVSITNAAAIRAELASLIYPLYFFDYETYPSAIPLFDGFSPYQQVPFQFSLHIVTSVDSEPEHREYLYRGDKDPSLEVIAKLKEFIGPVGSIIAWHKSFERDRTKELAQHYPEHTAFLEDLCNRLYDLEDIFKKRYFVHPDFKGKTSIKKVLPVLVPELSYNDLDIREGGLASQKWFEMCFSSISQNEKDKIASDLKKYCKMDTYAMYAIWKYLMTSFTPVRIVEAKPLGVFETFGQMAENLPR